MPEMGTLGRSLGERLLSLWEQMFRWPLLVQDAVLYGLSALFGASTALFAISSDYRAWGQLAGATYAGAAVVCLGGFALARRREASARSHQASALEPVGAVTARRRTAGLGSAGTIRGLAFAMVLLGAVLAPLFSQLVWRADNAPGQHAQPEVAVVERAADRVAAGTDPYILHPASVGISPRSDNPKVDADTFFPYLPGMLPFGLLNSLHIPAELRDARVTLVSFTLLVGVIALGLSGAPLARRGRAAQFLIALPTGALALVTGGDDMPVLALMLAGLVLAQRRRPVLAGLVLGFGGTLKFTSWPLLVFMLLAVRDREDRPAGWRFGGAVALVMVPAVALGLATGPSAFIENVVKFPLGLASVKSPAASPLLGQVLVKIFPREKTAVTALLLVVAAVIVIAAYLRYKPRTSISVARFTAFTMTVATALAPATRFGYLIYPANLWVWAYVLERIDAGPQQHHQPDRQSASSISNSVSAAVLVGSSVAPPRAGVIDAVTGFTTMPTSQ